MGDEAVEFYCHLLAKGKVACWWGLGLSLFPQFESSWNTINTSISGVCWCDFA